MFFAIGKALVKFHFLLFYLINSLFLLKEIISCPSSTGLKLGTKTGKESMQKKI